MTILTRALANDLWQSHQQVPFRSAQCVLDALIEHIQPSCAPEGSDSARTQEQELVERLSTEVRELRSSSRAKDLELARLKSKLGELYASLEVEATRHKVKTPDWQERACEAACLGGNRRP